MAIKRPEWWDTLDDAMAAGENRTPRRSIAVNYPNELYALVQEASRGRGMSMTAFQRRAALAIAQHDLGFHWLEIMQAEPPIGAFVTSGKGRPSAGLGFGAWHVQLLDEWKTADVE